MVPASVHGRRNSCRYRCAGHTGTAASLQRTCWHAWQHMRCWRELWRTPKHFSPLWSSCTCSTPRGSVLPLLSSCNNLRQSNTLSFQALIRDGRIRNFSPMTPNLLPAVFRCSGQAAAGTEVSKFSSQCDLTGSRWCLVKDKAGTVKAVYQLEQDVR